jgi:3',5'-cyclic AMP phosphodiesterase CpdA
MTLLAQITDTHVVDPEVGSEELVVDSNALLAQLVDRLGREQVTPDAVLATGDLTDHGTPTETEVLVELLAPIGPPVLAVPGNHDARETFRAAFDLPWAGPDNLSWAIDVGEVRVIGLDTVIPGSHGGLFDAEREAWMVRALEAAGDRPVVVAMHHPPFLSGIGWMDTMALEGRDRFAAVIARHPTVERVFCGHLHRPLVSTVGGVTTSVAPSPVQHVELNLAPDAAVEIVVDPGGYQLHHRCDGQWVSHIRFADGGQPIRPSWG